MSDPETPNQLLARIIDMTFTVDPLK